MSSLEIFLVGRLSIDTTRKEMLAGTFVDFDAITPLGICFLEVIDQKFIRASSFNSLNGLIVVQAANRRVATSPSARNFKPLLQARRNSINKRKVSLGETIGPFDSIVIDFVAKLGYSFWKSD